MYVKMKKMQQIISVILLVFMFISTIGTTVMALEPSSITASKSIESGEITSAGKKIVGILQTVGVVLSVIILTVIGIKYMMGSAEEKAEYKKTFMPYIIGAALIFAASVFAQIAYDFFNGLANTKSVDPNSGSQYTPAVK